MAKTDVEDARKCRCAEESGSKINVIKFTLFSKSKNKTRIVKEDLCDKKKGKRRPNYFKKSFIISFGVISS